MTVGSAVYTLLRSNGNGSFNPVPTNRLFVNSQELWMADNINTNTNADVINKSGTGDSSPRYSYAALFITAVGVDVNTYTNIYSTPALIHVFQLPEPF